VTSSGGDSVVTMNVPCFAADTRIATPRGEVAVEALCVGDEVSLASGGSAPLAWIGRRQVDCRSHPRPQDVWPVRVRQGAFAPGIPHRDLFLSPDHAVFAEDVLIPIKYLLNDDTIRQVARKTVEYFHLELPDHDVVLADGLAVESYLDTGDRDSFANAGPVVTLFPAFSSLVWEAYGYAPLVVTGPPVNATRRRIEIQARRGSTASYRQKRRCTA
jgi:collagen type I/II/III/V/XI/XXIV/XXVII alpha